LLKTLCYAEDNALLQTECAAVALKHATPKGAKGVKTKPAPATVIAAFAVFTEASTLSNVVTFSI
jgi:hypothetical protein